MISDRFHPEEPKVETVGVDQEEEECWESTRQEREREGGSTSSPMKPWREEPDEKPSSRVFQV